VNVETTIFVTPTAKARARTFTNKAGQVRAYTPATTRKAEGEIRRHMADVLAGNRFAPMVPIKLSIIFWLQRPASCPKTRAFPTVRPDIDNYFKTVLDACNEYVYADDGQIVTALVRKRYCLQGKPPRIEIYMTEEKE
jgi:Holliday junction resolvase RusA-like endonuclease